MHPYVCFLYPPLILDIPNFQWNIRLSHSFEFKHSLVSAYTNHTGFNLLALSSLVIERLCSIDMT
jgi:hypothetical protein